MSTVGSYEKIDDYTVKIVCNEPNALLLAHLKDLMILDKETCEGQTDEWIALNPNGTGRYKFVEHVRGDKIVFERNEDYWGELPEAEKVTFKPITNEGTRTANMVSGAVDLIINVPVRDIEMLESNDKVEIVSEPSLRIIYLNLAGWTDTPSRDAKMPLKSPDGSNPFKDIKVNLNLMSRNIFFTYIGSANKEGDNTHFCMTGWADSGGESALMGLDLVYSMSQDGYIKQNYGGVNRGYYQNPEVDKLVDQAIATADSEERDKIMQKVWQIAADDISYIPLHFQQDIYAHNKDIVYHPRKDAYVHAWDIEFNK